MPASDGLVLETVEDIEATAAFAVRHGYQLNTYAIGDRAVREVLDIYERVWKRTEVDGSELRWRVEHAQHIVVLSQNLLTVDEAQIPETVVEMTFVGGKLRYRMEGAPAVR